MKNYDRLIAADSTISDQDVLCSTIKTLGYWESTFDLDHVSYKLIDGKNSRSWTQSRDLNDSDYMMFVVSLPSYVEYRPGEENMVGDSPTLHNYKPRGN